MNDNGKKKLVIGPNIVRAWFDTVINPLLHVMRTEQNLVGERNWTWRFEVCRLESIRPINEAIPYPEAENLEQFVSHLPDEQPCIRKHDEACEAVLSECQKLQCAIESDPAFEALFARVTTLEELEKLRPALRSLTKQIALDRDDWLAEIFGSFSSDSRARIVAEFMVNSTGQLPFYNPTAPFWNEHREKFLALFNQPALNQAYQTVLKAGQNLGTAIEDFSLTLRNTREQLSLEFDVPYFGGGAVVERVI